MLDNEMSNNIIPTKNMKKKQKRKKKNLTKCVNVYQRRTFQCDAVLKFQVHLNQLCTPTREKRIHFHSFASKDVP